MREGKGAGTRSRRKGQRPELLPLRSHVAGIDIGSRQMQVCAPTEEGEIEVRTFGTSTAEIMACAQWLQQLRVESVAMESTGVYWIPVLEILEGCGLETLLVDTRPLSRVPGRKTDVGDATWTQTLHSHGLLRGCFRPSEQISQLRSLIRQKAVLVADQANWTRRMQKCLDQMNVRVHHAVSDAQGVTGMRIIRAIVGGERDPGKLAELRDVGCRKSRKEMADLLNGHWRADHLFNLAQSLRMYDAIEEQLGAYESEIQRRMRELTPGERAESEAPALRNGAKRKAMKRRQQEEKRQALYRLAGVDLTTIDGVGTETAEVVISEYGVEMSRFASEKEFVSHVKLAPRQNITGGKPVPKRGRTKATRVSRALHQAAVAVGKGPSALGAYYRRISRRKGATIAVFATARKIGTLIYRMLRWGQAYVDIGQQAYEERYQDRRMRSLRSTAAELGYQLVKQAEAVSI